MLKPFLNKVLAGDDLTREEMSEAVGLVMDGQGSPTQIAGLLVALRSKGEVVTEMAGAAQAMRARMNKLDITRRPLIDTCGTGGDASGSYNVSTGAALVVAACGVPVAKHGNRALSSKSGSADILTALGVNIEADIPLVERAITEVGIGFLMAPRHHGAMRHVAGTRVELGTRTIFNILGPLSNPAGTERQVIGVFDAKWLRPVAEVLGKLGSSRVWVVHGDDGMDELTTTASSQVAELRDGNVSTFSVTPEDAGLTRAAAAALKGGDPKENAAALRAVLDGEVSAYRDIVLLNAAAALVVAERAANLAEGVAQATAAVDGGKAREVLAKLVDITNGSA